MTERERCQAEQRAAAEALEAGDTSPGAWLWLFDWMAEEALIVREER